MSRNALTMAFLALLGSGCEGAIVPLDRPIPPGQTMPPTMTPGVDSGTPIVVPPPPATAVRVELMDTAPISLPSECLTLAAGEALLDVSPEGDAWLSTHDGVRVVGRDLKEIVHTPLRAGRPDSAIALSDYDGVVIAEGNLFRIGAAEVAPVEIPPELGLPLDLCGDPARIGAAFFVATELGLHTIEAGQWVRWSFEGRPLMALDPIAEQSGACVDGHGELWFRDSDGVLRMDSRGTSIARVDALNDVSSLARQDATLVATAEDEVWVVTGGETERFAFDLGVPELVSLGQGIVWLWFEGALARRDPGGEWALVEHSMVPGAVHADELGDLWLSDSTRVCVTSSERWIRVRGIEPHRMLPGDIAIRFETSASASNLQVRIDGQNSWVTSTSTRGGTEWQSPTLAMGAPGSHRLDVTAIIGGESVSRSIEYHVLDTTPVSWTADIAPDFQTYCAGCHGTGGAQTNLSSADSYRRLARSIRDRMALGEMPPSPATPVPSEVVDRMQRWIEGGMQP